MAGDSSSEQIPCPSPPEFPPLSPKEEQFDNKNADVVIGTEQHIQWVSLERCLDGFYSASFLPLMTFNQSRYIGRGKNKIKFKKALRMRPIYLLHSLQQKQIYSSEREGKGR